MSQPEYVLSFALNPLTDRFEFVPVLASTLKSYSKSNQHVQNQPKISKSLIKQPTINQSKNVRARKVKQLEMQQGDLKEEQVKDLNSLLNSLIEKANQCNSVYMEFKTRQAISLGKQVSVNLLVMMDYTQKLRYLSKHCSSIDSLCSQEIQRVSHLIFQEQQRYFQVLLQQFVPN